MSEEQLDIVGRLVQYTYYKSMNQLRERVKKEFISRGWKDDLKKFKLVQTTHNKTVSIYLNPRYLKDNS